MSEKKSRISTSLIRYGVGGCIRPADQLLARNLDPHRVSHARNLDPKGGESRVEHVANH